jgi:3-(3-hydroxy-phenyl)propionate hydroxylase
MYEFGQRPTGNVGRAVPARLIEMEDPEGTFFQWLRRSGGRSGSIAIVRPDKFVFALVPVRGASAATRELVRQLDRTAAGPIQAAQRSLQPAMKEAA